MTALVDAANRVISEVNSVILGKDKEVREIMTAFAADGHILLEDIPGVGKTTLANAFSKAMGLESRRVQFTPDVMPSDLTGFSVYQKDKEEFVYQKGSVFCNLLLADEINRTSPKTQSALLEVMEEKHVSVEGVTRPVPSPFLVIATQNPTGAAGTQLLPEAQIDRFMINMSIGYPDFNSELSLAMSVSAEKRTDRVNQVLDGETLLAIQKDIHTIYIKEELYSYMLTLVTATRNNPYLERGASPRATIAMVKMAKASAWMNNRRFVIPYDITSQLPYVLVHRISLSSGAKMSGVRKQDVIQKIIDSYEPPFMGNRR